LLSCNPGSACLFQLLHPLSRKAGLPQQNVFKMKYNADVLGDRPTDRPNKHIKVLFLRFILTGIAVAQEEEDDQYCSNSCKKHSPNGSSDHRGIRTERWVRWNTAKLPLQQFQCWKTVEEAACKPASNFFFFLFYSLERPSTLQPCWLGAVTPFCDILEFKWPPDPT